MPDAGEGYAQNVFINCPFDREYHSLLRPLFFTLVWLGFNPKIASERSDSGELRLQKINALIRESRLSIHDLSRLQAGERGEFYRMNMAFELGIEFGCRLFGGETYRAKRCLVLAEEAFDYVKALSDLAGIDIKSHQGKPPSLVRQVRNWLVETARVRNAASATAIWKRFNLFTADFYTKRAEEGFEQEDLDMMPVPEYLDFIRGWVASQKSVT